MGRPGPQLSHSLLQRQQFIVVWIDIKLTMQLLLSKWNFDQKNWNIKKLIIFKFITIIFLSSYQRSVFIYLTWAGLWHNVSTTTNWVISPHDKNIYHTDNIVAWQPHHITSMRMKWAWQSLTTIKHLWSAVAVETCMLKTITQKSNKQPFVEESVFFNISLFVFDVWPTCWMGPLLYQQLFFQLCGLVSQTFNLLYILICHSV